MATITAPSHQRNFDLSVARPDRRDSLPAGDFDIGPVERDAWGIGEVDIIDDKRLPELLQHGGADLHDAWLVSPSVVGLPLPDS